MFNKTWYNCNDAILNHIIYSLDKNREDLIYSNDYKYDSIGQPTPSGESFYSFQTYSTSHQKLYNLLFEYRKRITCTNGEELINTVIELLEQEHIVILHVDMYYYLPSMTSIYHVNHIPHLSFVHEYNEKDQTFYVYESKKEMISKKDLAEACLKGDGIIRDYKMKRNIVLPSISQSDVIRQSKQIIQSIENNILSKNNLWILDSPNHQDIDYFLTTASTHLDNIKNRNFANAWLYENILEPNCKSNPFKEIEQEFSNLRKLVIKNCITYNWKNISDIKEKVLDTIAQECNVWNSL